MIAVKSLKALPPALLVLLFACLIVPAWSFVASTSPDAVWLRHGAGAAALSLLTFWLLPLGIVGAIWRRHILFLPLFLAECMALAFYVALYADSLGDGLQWVRYAVIGCTAILGLGVASRDVLAPLQDAGTGSGPAAAWRGSPRLVASIRTRAVVKQGDKPVYIVVEDMSLSGMAVSMTKAHAAELSQTLVRGSRLTVLAPEGELALEVPCEIVWERTDGPLQCYGLRALSPKAMAVLIEDLGDSQRRGMLMPFWLGKVLIDAKMRRALTVLWALSIVAMFVVPTL
jgi:hypothetical protein